LIKFFLIRFFVLVKTNVAHLNFPYHE